MNLQSEIISFRPRSRYVLRFSQDVVRSSWSSSGVMPPLWHTILSLKFVFKRGQCHLPYILLLLGNRSWHVIYRNSNRISKKSIINHDMLVNHL